MYANRFKIQNCTKPTIIGRIAVNAIALYHFWWRKKKVDGYIIPPFHFTGKLGNTEVTEEIVTPEKVLTTQKNPPVEAPKTSYEIPESKTISQDNKIKAFSLKSIQQKKDLLAQLKPEVLEETIHLAEPFIQKQATTII